ncbi:DnaJ subfamily C member 27 [Fasciolopsis buskii]|uniref:DnaJ subfamily C member 27 n=1 Tax=Fasciolopsis buskii TaxID=27845 RepID=A0A8E0S8Z3_9TREM|nr:DnaJ subfamily C member 27 [Fasciolopsis buski]
MPHPKTRPISIKLLTLGNAGTGKSCLIKRYCEKRFVSRYQPTIGIDYGVINATIRNKAVKVNIFDTSGDPVFFEVRNEFYRDCDGVLLVFDLKSRLSFDSLDKWLFEMKSELRSINNPLTARFCVCGNKVDQTQRIVSYFEASQWCANNSVPYFETSALTGHGVNDAINTLLESILEPDVCKNFMYSRPLYHPSGTQWFQSCTDSQRNGTQAQFQKSSPSSVGSESNTQTSYQSGGLSEAGSKMNNSTGYTPGQLQAVTRIRQAKTYEERLGVGFRATKDEINRAYRKLAFAVHPDKNFAPGSEDAFKLLVAARAALLQPGISPFDTKFYSEI